MRTLRDAGRGRTRRPVALAATAVIAAMLVPAGAAVADPGTESTETTTVTTTSTEPVAVTPAESPESTGTDAGSTDTGATTTSTTTTTTSEGSASSGSEGSEGTGSGQDDTVVIDPENTQPQPVAVTPDAGAPSNQGNQQSPSTQDAPEQTMDVSYTFSGLTWDDEWEDSYATVGERIRYTAHGTFPADAEFDVDWYADDAWVGNGPFYTPKAADQGKGISIAWTVSAPGYEPHNGGQSVAYTTVPGVQKMRGQIDVSGTTGPYGDAVAYLDRTLVATPNGEWPVDAQFSYEWEVGGQFRSAGDRFTPWITDLGRDVFLYVTVTAPGYEDYFTGVAVASTVKDVPQMQLGEVEISGRGNGEPALGTRLTAVPKGWPAGAVFTYEWTVNGQERASTASYTPTAQDLGGYIEVRVDATHPDFQPAYRHVWAGTVVTTPTVSVASTTVTAGDSAFLPVTVSGPKGGPVPTGAVEVTLTPKAGGASVSLGSQQLDGGVAGFVTSDVPAGVYTVKASYVSKPIFYARSVSLLAADHSPYLSATGTGTLTVVAPKPVLTAPATISTAVATRASFSATVALPGKPLPETWTVREGASVVARGDVVKGGAISVTLPVLSVGTHTLVLEVPATARTAAASTTVTLTVTGEPARTGATPTAGTVLETPKSATTPGQQMELVATGFLEGETVAFYLHSEPMFLGTAVAGADGVARLLATIPAGAPTGSHTVIATGGTSGRWATLAVELAVPAATPVANPVAAAPAAAGELAVTGSQSGTLMAGAWMLLLVGGGLMLVARRVRATR